MVGNGTIVLKDAATLSEINITSSDKDVHPVNLVRNYQENTLITGVSYRDSIYNSNSNVTINTGAGNDSVYNYGDSVKVDMGAGNDSIYNSGDSVIIDGGTGNDTITNYSSNVTINGGKGNDRIYLSEEITDVVINYAYGDGDDTVFYSKPFNKVNLIDDSVENTLTSGNDLILLTKSGSIRFVNANAVNVNGKIYGNTNTKGTTGDDAINNFSSKVTINAKAGNDLISNGGKSVSINTGEGLDTIENYGENTTIKAGSGTNYIYNYGTATVQGTAEADDLELNGKNITLNTGAGNDSIYNYAESVSIDAGAGDDYVHSSGDYSQFKLGEGNDYFYSSYGYNSTVDGGAGSDSIRGSFSYSFITGGAGNDHISLHSSSSYGSSGNTVRGGKGDDTIYSNDMGYGALYEYATGDGNDLIEGFKMSDTLLITDTGDYSIAEDGLDVIVTVGNGKVTIKNAANFENIKIESKIVKLTDENATFDNFISGASVSSGDGTDIIYNNQANNVSINSGAGSDSLKNYYGQFVTIEAGAGDDSVLNEDGSYSKINGGAGADYISVYSSDNTTIDAGEGDDTISNSYSNDISINGGAGNDSVYSSGVNVSINGGKGDDTFSSYDDGVGTVYIYNKGDGDKIIYGVNDDDTILIKDGSWTKRIIGSDIFIMVGKGTIVLKDAATLSEINITSSAKDVHPVNLVRNYQNNTLITGINYRDSVYNGGSDVTINTGAGNDTVYNRCGHDSKISLGAGRDSIFNSGDSVIIDGGADDDTIENGNSWNKGGSKVSVTGGKGNDQIYLGYNATKVVVNYASGDGNDTVYNYNPSDKVNLVDDSVENALVSGNDLILMTKSSAIQFLNANAVKVNGKIYGNTNTKGTSSDDFITIFDSKVTINAKEGNDLISNGGKNVSINTGNGLDTVKNYGANATIKTDGSGMKYIHNYGTATVQGTAEADDLKLYGENITLNTDAGNDSIYNDAESVSIDAGAGDDYVHSSGDYSQFKLGEGNDYFYSSYGYNSTISAGAGNDTITGYFNYNSINAGAGNDHISLMGTNFMSYYRNTIIAGKGDDTIYANVNDGILYQYKKGDGNDLIYNVSWNDTLKISGSTFSTFASGNDLLVSVEGSGTITLYAAASANVNIISSTDMPITMEPVEIEPGKNIDNTKDNVSLTGGGGDDTIKNSGEKVFIEANGGSDSIQNSGNKVSIEADSGNDSIQNSGKKARINSGDGSDIVENKESGENTSIYTNKGDDSIKNSAANSSINAGVGNDTINNTAQKVSINAGGGADLIIGENDYVTVLAGAGKDTILGDYYHSKIKGDNDNDFISLSSFWYNTIAGGNGNDKIYAGGSEHSISGGAGNDLINLTGDRLTINGGKGNDTVYGSTATSHLYQYKKGDGNDLIYNVSSNDTIMLSGVTSSEWSSVKSGDNLIIKVGGLGNITLVGGKKNTPKIYSEDSVPDSDDKDITAQKVIKDVMKTLATTKNSGITALSEAVSVATGGYFSNINFAINQMIDDRENISHIVPFLENYCGIVLNNKDTGAITGSDAGTLKTKTAKSIVKEEGDLDTTFNDTSFKTKDGLTFRLYNSNLSKDEKYMWRALKTWWAENTLELIKESYGYSFKDSDASVKDITVEFVNDPFGGYLAKTSKAKTIDGIETRVLTINKFFYNNFSNDDKNGISPSGKVYLDRTIAHELTHAVMMAKIKSFWELPEFFIEGTAELTHGIDDFRTFDAMDALSSTTNLKTALSFLPWGDKSDSYAAGYIFMRYLAKQGAEHYPTASDLTSGFNNMSVAYSKAFNSKAVTVKNKVLTVAKDFTGTEVDLTKYASNVKSVDASKFAKGVMIFGNVNANSVTTGKGNDTIFANTGNDTLNGGKGNDILSGEAGNDKLYGGKGNDMLVGGTGNDSLIGGEGNDSLWGDAGKDTFIYASDAGKDVIYGFENDDMLKITGTFSGSYSKSKGEIYFKVDSTSNAITLKDFSATSFNINGTKYKISGSKLVKK